MTDSEYELSRTCEHCGEPFIGKRRDAKYCSKAHQQAAAQARRRKNQRVNSKRESMPTGVLAAFDELSDDTDEPDAEVDELAWVDQTFRDDVQTDMTLDALRAHYDSLAAPYLAQLRRNPGRKPDELVALENEYGRALDKVTTARARARGFEIASQRAFLGREYSDLASKNSLYDFARDLGRKLYDEPAPFDLTHRR